MFCSKCGTKIELDDKFCKKCGEKVIAGEGLKEESLKETLKEDIISEIRTEEAEKKELKEEIKKELKEEKLKAKNKWTWSSCLSAILILVFVIGVVTMGSGTVQDKQISTGLMTFSASTLGIWFLIWAIPKIIKGFAKNWRKMLLILGAFLVVTFFSAVVYMFGARGRVATNFTAFQNGFSDVITAKYLGDDIIAGKASGNFTTVKAITKTALDNMAKVKSADPYYKAVYEWAGKINTAATNGVWRNLPDLPSGVNEVLIGSVAKNFYQLSLDHVALLKDYGDWAVAKGDKDTMRQIAAELKAEETWQNNLSDKVTIDFVEQVYALTISTRRPKTKLPRGGCKGVAPCRKKTGPLIGNLSQAARNYSVGTPDAAKEWKSGWEEFLKIVTIENGYNLEGMAVIQNGEVKQQVSPMDQAFNDDCKAKGGTTGGAGGVKDRLPTTLTAGTLNCDYKDNGHNCWDTMTRTGYRFMGGDNSCPEYNLLPKPAPVVTPSNNTNNTNNNKTTSPSTWNGHYNAQVTKPNCDSSVEITAFQVTGGKVVNMYGQAAAIGTDGRATVVFNTGTIMTMRLTFSKVSGKTVAKGTWSTSRGCSGTVSATKSFSFF